MKTSLCDRCNEVIPVEPAWLHLIASYDLIELNYQSNDRKVTLKRMKEFSKNDMKHDLCFACYTHIGTVVRQAMEMKK